MNFRKLASLVSATFVSAVVSISAQAAPTSGAYVDDEQRFFVGGQKLNDAIGAASAIICYMACSR